eukprot:CCRYP_016744-RA/>CCRYP_016744-RA protein AED:0.00 eAED:0.00 QI:37/-1/1/1/-1/1/1/832/409
MNDENNPNGTSRVSKLKKRRRPITTNSLGSRASRDKHGAIVNCANDGVEKVASAEAPSSALGQKMIDRGELSTISTSKVTLRYLSSAPSELKRVKYSRSDHPCRRLEWASGEPCRSIIGFVDGIDHSDLLAAIPSIVGVDMKRYHASNPEFVQAVNQAFPYRICSRKRNDEFVDTGSTGSSFHHPLVGCINVHAKGGLYTSKNEDCELSFAFPLATSTERGNTSKSPSLDIPYFDDFMRSKQYASTGHGKRIPLSFCRFPCSNAAMTTLEQKSNESARTLSPRATAEQKSKHHLHELQCRGKIRIEASIGASIREFYDIDKSQHVLGRLHYGDERYFVGKKVLPPPPISLDGSHDDACISVVRYKILLEPDDTTSSFAPRDELGRVCGWISDRGRLADDSYWILKEIGC